MCFRLLKLLFLKKILPLQTEISYFSCVSLWLIVKEHSSISTHCLATVLLIKADNFFGLADISIKFECYIILMNLLSCND